MSSQRSAALVIGAKGGIGSACVERFLEDDALEVVIGVSRDSEPPFFHQSKRLYWFGCDEKESNIKEVCENLTHHNLDLRYVVIATGILHSEDEHIKPEKRLSELSLDSLERVFEINAFLPVLWIKHLMKCLDRHSEVHIAVLSARVGSIADNRLGGWHSYRASKAALNMLLKNVAIEFKGKYPKLALTSFHPGTTDTSLSLPFQANVPKGKLFTPDFVADRLYQLLTEAKERDGFSFKDWAHEDILW